MDGSILPEVVEAKAPKAKKPKAPKDEKSYLPVVKEKELYVSQVLVFVSKYEITSQESMDDLGGLQAEAREIRETLEEQLKSLTKPLRDLEAAHRRDFKVAIDLATKVEDTCKSIAREYQLRVMREQNEALKAVEESGGKADPSTLAVAHGAGQVALAETQSGRVLWRWKETGEPIPEKYYVRVLNTKMIDEEVKLLRDKAVIAGVEIYQDVQIVNKRRA